MFHVKLIYYDYQIYTRLFNKIYDRLTKLVKKELYSCRDFVHIVYS